MLESVISLASDGALLYELLGYMVLSALFARTLFYLTGNQECLATCTAYSKIGLTLYQRRTL